MKEISHSRHPRASEFICEARNERDTGIQVNFLRKANNIFTGLDSTSRPPKADLAGMTESL